MLVRGGIGRHHGSAAGGEEMSGGSIISGKERGREKREKEKEGEERKEKRRKRRKKERENKGIK